MTSNSCTPDGGTVAPGKVTFEMTSMREEALRLRGHPTSARRRPAAAAPLRAVPLRQAAPHDADVPRPLPLRGDPRQRGARRQGHRAPLHRPEGLDRALRPDRRPECLRARAAAFRPAAGRDGPPQRRDHQDDRRCGDGGVPRSPPTRCRRRSTCAARSPPSTSGSPTRR